MSDRDYPQKRHKKPPKPLDSARLQELALAYVARFSTTQAKLEAYLQRKLRERGWDEEDWPDLSALSSRYVELGYIDDALYAKSKASSLLGRGYGSRRVDQALYAAGVGEGIRSDVAPDEAARRQSVLAMVRKRRFGPFYRGELEKDRREKQIAALLRAGHGFDCVRAVMDAPNENAAKEWAEEARSEDSFEDGFGQ